MLCLFSETANDRRRLLRVGCKHPVGRRAAHLRGARFAFRQEADCGRCDFDWRLYCRLRGHRHGTSQEG